MKTKEFLIHRLRDFDSIFKSNKKISLLKFVLIRTLYKFLGKNENDLKKIIPESYSYFKGLKFFSRKETLDFLFYSSHYEPETTKYLMGKRGNLFIDIGAHIGRFTLLGSKNFKEVFAFEANLKNYDILLKNIKLNSIKNIHPINLAISDRKKKLFLDMPELNTGATRISENGIIKTQAINLDDFAKSNKIDPEKVSLILIDVEGHEEKVFEGAQKFLSKTKAELIVECFDVKKIEIQLKKYGYQNIKCLDFYNYLFKKINSKKFRP